MIDQEKVNKMLDIAVASNVLPAEDGNIYWADSGSDFRFKFTGSVVSYDVCMGPDFWVPLKTYNIKEVNLANWEDTIERIHKYGKCHG